MNQAMIYIRPTGNASRLAGPLHLCRGRFNPVLSNKFHRRPQNEEIRHPEVQVVNEEGKLDPPIRLSAILAGIDRKKFVVQLVTDEQPIVKILDKMEEYKKTKALRKSKKAAQRVPEEKEIQMTWGVAAGDLAHKISKVRKELEKKNRVHLIFAPKKRQPLPPPAEQNAKVDEVLEILKDVGKESRPRTFQKALLTLHLQAKVMDTDS